jgi:eukaryotic-like serine/threonine-protein kinase
VQTRTAETVRTFLLDIFRANSSEHADPVRARQTTARELLDIGATKIDGALQQAPEAKLSVLETLFRLYVDLGLQDRAVALGRRRVVLARSIYGPNHTEVARSLIELAANSGASSFSDDRPALLKEAGRILDRNRDSLSPTRALYYLAMGNSSFRTDMAGAETFGARSVKLYRQYPPSHELVSALNLLGQAQDHQQEYRAAIASLSDAAGIANSLGGEARGPLPAIYAYLGDAQRHTMDLNGAEKSLRQAVEVARALKGDEHVDVLQTKYRLGIYLAQTSRPQEGLAFLKEAVALALRTQGPDETFHTPMVREGYGIYLLQYGRVEEALVPIGQCIDALRRANQSGTHSFANTLEWVARAETELGHHREAEAMLAEASATHARLGPTPPDFRSDSVIAAAKVLMAIGKAEQAARTLEEFPLEVKGSDKISYDWLNISLARAESNTARNHADQAIDQARQVRNRIEESGLGTYFKRWEAQAALLEGKGLELQGHAADALLPLQRAVQLGSQPGIRRLTDRSGEMSPRLGSTGAGPGAGLAGESDSGNTQGPGRTVQETTSRGGSPLEQSQLDAWALGARSFHFAGTVAGAPFCLTRNTRNLAGLVLLAFLETVCTSSGDS